MWISNAPIADIFVIWAKSDAHYGKIKGFILEEGRERLSAPKIEGKLPLRASVTGEIVVPDFSTVSRRGNRLTLLATRKPSGGKPVHLVVPSRRCSSPARQMKELTKETQHLNCLPLGSDQ